MNRRLRLYLITLPCGLALPALMLWFPDTYTTGLNFVLTHMKVMAVLPIGAFACYLPAVRATRPPYRTWVLIIGFALLTMGLAYYFRSPNLTALGYVTLVPALFIALGALYARAKSPTPPPAPNFRWSGRER